MSSAVHTPLHETVFTIPDSPIRHAGLNVLVFFLFCAFSRILDFHFFQLRLPFLTSLLALGCALFAARIHRAIAIRAGTLFVVLTIWMALGIPFAFWKSNSINTLVIW